MTQVGSASDLFVPVARAAAEDATAPVVPAQRAAAATVAATGTKLRWAARAQLRLVFLAAEVLLALILALVVTSTLQTPVLFAAAVTVLTLAVNYHGGLETIRPGLPHIARILKDQAVPVLVVAVAITLGVLPRHLLNDTIYLVATVGGVAVLATVLRRAAEGRVRIVLVGNGADVAGAATRWAGDRRAKVVGAVLLDGAETSTVTESFGVPATDGVREVARWADTWRADMVVVAPGPQLTSRQVRQIAWDLESSSASFAVLGLLDSVAPHRIDTARFADATLLHVRSSRPSALVLALKSALSWVVAALLMVVAAPLIGLLALLVRLDSPGPAIFKQTRVGLRGRTFTMYKLRSMVQDAEAIRSSLAAMDEGNGVLFKIHRDPRLTRLGGFLRRSSLDELPQLLNVLKGEMSLIGPRPALPAEVEKYDEFALRRLAVKPGLTGLWQVSGRSSLSWDRSLQLDLDYVDNWRLADDLLIGLRTVDAVARRKGAY